YGIWPMNVPQFGIVAQGRIAHEFIEFDLRPDVDMGAGDRGAGPPARSRGIGRRRQPGDRVWQRPVAGGGTRRGARRPRALPGAGGSHILVMRWIHSLDSFEALAVGDQERVFGRTKMTSDELEGDAKPVTAHIARVEIHDDAGAEMPIFRRSVPYGTVHEHGLQFVAFSAERGRFDRMLGRMFGMNADGHHDRLTDFSRPVSGAFYFAPALTLLATLAEAWGASGREVSQSTK
ncbi:MAG: Dyp-type peroxidase, partial [Candidatus Limnocylindria bacterium]